jgi:WD repeat-containing protein 7
MATFTPESEKNWKILQKIFIEQQAQIKQTWSLISTHHSFLLLDKVDAMEPKNFKLPQVELMAWRWQHHCIEIHDAAQ